MDEIDLVLDVKVVCFGNIRSGYKIFVELLECFCVFVEEEIVLVLFLCIYNSVIVMVSFLGILKFLLVMIVMCIEKFGKWIL